MHQLQDSFFSRRPSRVVFVEIQWLQNSITSALFQTFTTVLLDRTGEKPLVFFSEDSLTVLVLTAF